MDMVDHLLPIIGAVICIIIINTLVMAKFSFARFREEQLEDMEEFTEEQKEYLHKVYQLPDKLINTAQYLIIFFIILLSTILSNLMERVLAHFEISWAVNGTWQMMLVDFAFILIMSTIVLLFGEIIPKSLGLSFPERHIIRGCKIVLAASKLVRPFVWTAARIGYAVTGDAKYRTEMDLVHTEEEIRMMVERSRKEGELDHVESELIDNVFDFVDRIAKEVMIPRQNVDCVYVDDDFEETLKIVRKTAHSRYPLCDGDKDHIIGLIHIKDLMERQQEARSNITRIRRDILTIPETMKLSTLLQFMRTKRIYLANVVDEYGGMVGLVGLEDILEELVGDIQDEHDENRPAVAAYSDGTFEFDGMVLVDEVEDTMEIDIDDNDEDTIGGYVFGLLGRPPIKGDEVQIEGYTFTVTEMQGYRITRLKAVPIPVEEDPNETDTKDNQEA
ncbi:MAG: HlyC/CorC family transporter [Veillonella sp.]|nr:HlyC/CorC family transporter [Veillonella sp.]